MKHKYTKKIGKKSKNKTNTIQSGGYFDDVTEQKIIDYINHFNKEKGMSEYAYRILKDYVSKKIFVYFIYKIGLNQFNILREEGPETNFLKYIEENEFYLKKLFNDDEYKRYLQRQNTKYGIKPTTQQNTQSQTATKTPNQPSLSQTKNTRPQILPKPKVLPKPSVLPKPPVLPNPTVQPPASQKQTPAPALTPISTYQNIEQSENFKKYNKYMEDGVKVQEHCEKIFMKAVRRIDSKKIEYVKYQKNYINGAWDCYLHSILQLLRNIPELKNIINEKKQKISQPDQKLSLEEKLINPNNLNLFLDALEKELDRTGPLKEDGITEIGTRSFVNFCMPKKTLSKETEQKGIHSFKLYYQTAVNRYVDQSGKQQDAVELLDGILNNILLLNPYASKESEQYSEFSDYEDPMLEKSKNLYTENDELFYGLVKGISRVFKNQLLNTKYEQMFLFYIYFDENNTIDFYNYFTKNVYTTIFTNNNENINQRNSNKTKFLKQYHINNSYKDTDHVFEYYRFSIYNEKLKYFFVCISVFDSVSLRKKQNIVFTNLTTIICLGTYIFEPISIVCHTGEKINSGHYVNYSKQKIKDGDVSWVFYDDTSKEVFAIENLDEHRKEQKATPYLILYRKII